MICLKCGESNEENSVKCPGCQNILSRIPPHTSHISQLIREGEAVYNGKGDPESLENMVENLFQRFDELEDLQNELKKRKIPEVCDRAFEQFQEATLMLFDGLDELDIYFEDFDKIHIAEGLQLLKDAEGLHLVATEEFKDIAEDL